jgi:hypothetical protein
MAVSDKHVAILADDDYQELELHYPRLRLIEAGARAVALRRLPSGCGSGR